MPTTTLSQMNTLLNTGKGKKVSMLIENSMGAIVLRHIILHENSVIYHNDKAQFHMDREIALLNLYYTAKGCRKPKGYRISKGTLLTLALDWQTIEGMEESKAPGTFSLNRWDCFDGSRYQTLSKQLKNVIYNQPS